MFKNIRLLTLIAVGALFMLSSCKKDEYSFGAVSYTHLDVYKRQAGAQIFLRKTWPVLMKQAINEKRLLF